MLNPTSEFEDFNGTFEEKFIPYIVALKFWSTLYYNVLIIGHKLAKLILKQECFLDDSNTEGFQYLKQDSNIFKRSDNLSHPETNQEFAESIQSRATIS